MSNTTLEVEESLLSESLRALEVNLKWCRASLHMSCALTLRTLTHSRLAKAFEGQQRAAADRQQ